MANASEKVRNYAGSKKIKGYEFQDLAIFVMGFWMIVFSISLFRLRNRVYMVQGSKVPIGSDYGAVLGEKFPVTKFTTINGEPISLDSAEKNTVLLILDAYVKCIESRRICM